MPAIDHNSHAFQKQAFTTNGKQKMSKVFSKKSKNWRITTVKEPKTYDFWPTFATRILKKRVDDEETILRKVEVPKEHPKNIAPSIALKPIPKTSDLWAQSLSRFVSRTAGSSHDHTQGANETQPQPTCDHKISMLSSFHINISVSKQLRLQPWSFLESFRGSFLFLNP